VPHAQGMTAVMLSTVYLCCSLRSAMQSAEQQGTSSTLQSRCRACSDHCLRLGKCYYSGIEINQGIFTYTNTRSLHCRTCFGSRDSFMREHACLLSLSHHEDRFWKGRSAGCATALAKQAFGKRRALNIIIPIPINAGCCGLLLHSLVICESAHC